MTTIDGYYLNLDRSTARNDTMRAELERVGMPWVRRFPAVDGAAVALPANWPLQAGAYGCFLSHRSAIEQSDPDSFTLILEDDVELADDLPSTLSAHQLGELQSWDMVFLECQPNILLSQYLTLWPTLLRRLHCYKPGAAPDDRRAQAVEILEAFPIYRWGATAYLVTPKGKRTLSRLLASETEGTFTAIDSVYSRQIAAGNVKAAVIMPFLASPRMDQLSNSTIEGREQHADALLAYAMRRLCFAGPLGALDGFLAPAASHPLSEDPAVKLFAAAVPELLALMEQHTRV